MFLYITPPNGTCASACLSEPWIATGSEDARRERVPITMACVYTGRAWLCFHWALQNRACACVHVHRCLFVGHVLTAAEHCWDKAL